MTENNDLERYQSMLAQLRAMSDKQMACELECSRMAADNDELKAEAIVMQGDIDSLIESNGQADVEIGLLKSNLNMIEGSYTSLETKCAAYKNEITRLVETFEGMGSTLGPGKGYGEGAIKKAREVLRANHEQH